MSKIFLGSYKGTHRGLAGIVNVGIRALDRAKYSHSEICVGSSFDDPFECYSSSGVDHGVRQKTMRLAPEKWDLLYLPFVDEKQIRQHFLQTQGAPYDFWGVGRFALPFLLREHPTAWFCSEWCLAAVGMTEPWRFSPSGAHSALIARGGIQA